MKRKYRIILIRVMSIIGFFFAAFNCYRGFAKDLIPVAISFLFIGIVALVLTIRPTFIIDEKLNKNHRK